jgi:hypothetical protein
MTYPIRREILRGDSSFVMRFIMPEHWDVPTAQVSITITDVAGNALVSAAAATFTAATTTSAAVQVQDREVPMAADKSWVSDDVLRVGSAAQGWQQMIVDTYTAATKIAVFKERFHTAYASGSDVQGRTVTYAVDASGWASTINEVTVQWINDTDDLPVVETWRVLKRVKDVGGLEEIFRATYPTEYSEIQQDSYSVYQDRAHRILSTQWDSDSLDLDKLMNRDNEYRELLLRQMAMLINPTEFNISQYNDYYSRVSTMLKWIDEDQDLIKDESEVLAGTSFDFERNI